MPRSVSVSAVQRRILHPLNKSPRNSSLEDTSSSHSSSTSSSKFPLNYPSSPREYDSCPCDSFFLLPDSVLSMDADTFRKDLAVLDPVLSASLPDWGQFNNDTDNKNNNNFNKRKSFRNSHFKNTLNNNNKNNNSKSGSLLHNHQGLTVTSAGKGTVLIGGGGGGGSGSDGHVNGSSGATNNNNNSYNGSDNVRVTDTSTSNTQHTSRRDDNQHTSQRDGTPTTTTSTVPPLAPPMREACNSNSVDCTSSSSTTNNTTKNTQPPLLAGPNEIFFGTERSASANIRDREERLRHLRDKQQNERQLKLDELKQHAAAAQRFREQQDTQRRHRLQELRSRDQDRRLQVEERRKYMDMAEQDRKEQVLRKGHERDQRVETKRRNERSNIVFAFGSSTSRMLDPKETMSYWASRRATSTTNVTMTADGTSASRRSSDCVDTSGGGPLTSSQGGGEALARKRATSAQGLDRNSGEMRMSSSMYEVFNWTAADGMETPNSVSSPMTPTKQGEDLMSRSTISSVARRRTDLHPMTPSLRDGAKGGNQRSPGRAVSMSRLDQLAKPRQYPPSPHLLSPLHEKGAKQQQQTSMSNTTPHSRTRSMTHLAGRAGGTAGVGIGSKTPSPSPPTLNRPLSRSTAALVRSTRAEQLRVKSRSQLQGGRSTGITPSGSRPTSALSHASTSTAGGVAMRPRSAATRRPRPMSIAGTALTSADSRARSPHRNRVSQISGGSSTSSLRSASSRAKSVTADGSAPSAPARIPSTGPRTPKRTPSQVKADHAQKSAEKAKSSTTTQSATKKTSITKSNNVTPSKQNKDAKTKTTTTKETTVILNGSVNGENVSTSDDKQSIVDQQTVETVVTTETVEQKEGQQQQEQESIVVVTETVITIEGNDQQNEVTETKTTVETIDENGDQHKIEDTVTPIVTIKVEDSVVPVADKQEKEAKQTPIEESKESKIDESDKTTTDEPVQSTNKEILQPTIEEVKTNCVEESNTAADDNRKDLPTESQDKKENSSSDKPVAGYNSEEEYKAVLAEKRRLAREAKEREAEMERLRVEEEAERERREEVDMLKVMDEQRKAEQERLQKAIEAAEKEREEDKVRRDEEEVQRIEAERLEGERLKEAEEKLQREEEERRSRKHRVAAIMARTRKGGGSTPNKPESKTPSDENKSISEVLQKANLTDSMIDTMSDSMIAAATLETSAINQTITEIVISDDVNLATSETESIQATSGVSSAAPSEFSSQPPSDVSTAQPSEASLTSGASSMDQETVRHEETLVETITEKIDNVTNGNVTTEVNGHHDNGVHDSNGTESIQSFDLLGSFDPFTPSTNTTTTEFEQIIDAGQTKSNKLSNEDSVNSNDNSTVSPVPPPIIAFQENNDNSVPDLLL